MKIAFEVQKPVKGGSVAYYLNLPLLEGKSAWYLKEGDMVETLRESGRGQDKTLQREIWVVRKILE